MGDGDRAEVRLGASGSDDVIRSFEDIRGAAVRSAAGTADAWQGVGSKMTTAVGGATRSIGSSLGTLAQDSIRVATALGNVSLARGVETARQFDDVLGRVVASRGVQLAELNTKLTATSKSILVGEPQILAESRAMANLTGDYRGALDAMAGLGEEAIATGRSADEMAPLGVVLKNVLNVAGDTRDALGTIRAQAEALGTVGGAAMFERQIEANAAALGHFSAKSDDARNRLTALVGVLGKGLSPQLAGEAQSSTLNFLQGSALDINRTLGVDILDRETGTVTDPARALRMLGAAMNRRGLKGNRGLLAWRRTLGNVAGTRVANALEHGELSGDEMARLAGLTPSTAAHDAAAGFAGSDAGHRAAVQLEQERSMRDAAQPLLGAQTAWGGMFASHPVAGLMAGNLASAAALAAIRGGPGAARGLSGLLGFGGAGAGGAVAQAASALGSGGSPVYVTNWPAGGVGGGAGIGSAAGAAGSTLSPALAAAEAELALFGTEGALATGTLSAFGIALAGIIPGAIGAAAVLRDVGENRQSMGKRWRDEHHVGRAEGDEEFSLEARRDGVARRAREKDATNEDWNRKKFGHVVELAAKIKGESGYLNKDEFWGALKGDKLVDVSDGMKNLDSSIRDLINALGSGAIQPETYLRVSVEEGDEKPQAKVRKMTGGGVTASWVRQTQPTGRMGR